MSEHTPGPIHVDKDLRLFIYGDDGFLVATVTEATRSRAEAEANAAYIVRCVNSHADLLAALEQIRDRECLEPSEYIAIYGEPSMTLGQLAGAAVDRVNAEEG